MQAAIVERFGPPEVVRVAAAPCPTPAPGELLVRVRASPVTAGDMRLRSGRFPRGFGPIARFTVARMQRRQPIPGWGFAGVVAAVGPGARTSPGTAVFGIAPGAHAEFVTVSENGKILPLPSSLSMEEGAGLFFGGLTAMDFLLTKTSLSPGCTLLVNGATGAVGSAALQIARYLGLRTTAVCRTENHALARALGAERVHDYREGPVDGRFDAVLDVAGTLPWRRARVLLAERGVLLPVTADLFATIGAALWPRRGSRRVTSSLTAETRPAMEQLVGLLAAGALRPLVGDVLPFHRIAEAHALAETMHRRGATVLVFDP